jgi:hypothetical protein
MDNPFSQLRLRIFLMRVALGLFFAYLLTRFFMPGAGLGAISIAAMLLVLFAYIFEAIHRS